MLAPLAGDVALIEAFLGGEDMHATVAGMVWGCRPTRSTEAMTEEGLASRMVLQVHDELVFEVAPAPGKRLAELVRQQTRDVYRLRVPLEVSMATGRSWAEAQP